MLFKSESGGCWKCEGAGQVSELWESNSCLCCFQMGYCLAAAHQPAPGKVPGKIAHSRARCLDSSLCSRFETKQFRKWVFRLALYFDFPYYKTWTWPYPPDKDTSETSDDNSSQCQYDVITPVNVMWCWLWSPAWGRRPRCSSAAACRHPPWPRSRPCSCGTGTGCLSRWFCTCSRLLQIIEIVNE